MTPDQRAALVEKVADAIAKAWDEHGRVIDAATAAIDLIRAEVLEEAEDAVGEVGDCAEVGAYINAIRALKNKP